MMRRKRRTQLYQGTPIPYSVVVGPDPHGTVVVVTGATDDVWAEQTTHTVSGRAQTVGAMRIQQNSGGDEHHVAAVHYRDRQDRPWRSANASREPQDVIDAHDEVRRDP